MERTRVRGALIYCWVTVGLQNEQLSQGHAGFEMLLVLAQAPQSKLLHWLLHVEKAACRDVHGDMYIMCHVHV